MMNEGKKLWRSWLSEVTKHPASRFVLRRLWRILVAIIPQLMDDYLDGVNDGYKLP